MSIFYIAKYCYFGIFIKLIIFTLYIVNKNNFILNIDYFFNDFQSN